MSRNSEHQEAYELPSKVTFTYDLERKITFEYFTSILMGIIADTGDSGTYTKICLAMAKLGLNLVINAGDFAYQHIDMEKHVYTPSKALQVPTVKAFGNHEYVIETFRTPDPKLAQGLLRHFDPTKYSLYAEKIPNHAQIQIGETTLNQHIMRGNYYRVQLDQTNKQEALRIIVLDTNTLPDHQEQQTFLQEEFKEAQQKNQWIMLIGHHPEDDIRDRGNDWERYRRCCEALSKNQGNFTLSNLFKPNPAVAVKEYQSGFNIMGQFFNRNNISQNFRCKLVIDFYLKKAQIDPRKVIKIAGHDHLCSTHVNAAVQIKSGAGNASLQTYSGASLEEAIISGKLHHYESALGFYTFEAKEEMLLIRCYKIIGDCEPLLTSQTVVNMNDFSVTTTDLPSGSLWVTHREVNEAREVTTTTKKGNAIVFDENLSKNDRDEILTIIFKQITDFLRTRMELITAGKKTELLNNFLQNKEDFIVVLKAANGCIYDIVQRFLNEKIALKPTLLTASLNAILKISRKSSSQTPASYCHLQIILPELFNTAVTKYAIKTQNLMLCINQNALDQVLILQQSSTTNTPTTDDFFYRNQEVLFLQRLIAGFQQQLATIESSTIEKNTVEGWLVYIHLTKQWLKEQLQSNNSPASSPSSPSSYFISFFRSIDPETQLKENMVETLTALEKQQSNTTFWPLTCSKITCNL